MVDIHKLGVFLGIFAAQAFDQSVGSIQRRQAGNGPLHRLTADLYVIQGGDTTLGGGRDDIGNLSALDQRKGIFLPGRGLMNLFYLGHRDACVCQNRRSTHSSIDGKAHLHKLLGNIRNLGLIRVLHRDKDAAFLIELIAGSYQSFKQRFLHGVGNAQNLAGGFHLRPQLVIHIDQLFEGEHRHLHRIIRRHLIKPGAVPHLRKLLPQHGPGGQIHHGNTGHLADIGDGAGGTGVDLDDIQLVVIDQILNIDKSFGLQRNRQIPGSLDDLFGHGLADVPGRIHRDGVTGMDAGAFDVFHNTRNENILPVTDGIYLQLGTHQIFINQYRVFNPLREDDGHIFLHIIRAKGDDHVLSAQHVGGTDQHRVSHILRRLERLLGGHNGKAFGAFDMVQLQQFVKFFPILRLIDALRRGSQNIHTVFREELGQLNGGLTAKGNHYAKRLFGADNPHHIL